MKPIQFLILFPICFGFSLFAHATIWRVNNNPAINANFSDFSAAVEGANSGDTLYVEGSQFSYNTQIITKPLVIIGPGYFLDQNDSTQVLINPAKFEALEVSSSAPGTIIYGISVSTELIIDANNVIVSRNWVNEGSYSAIRLAETAGVSNCAVIGNFCSYILSATNFYPALNVMIANNYTYEIQLNQYSSGVIINNVIRDEVSVYNALVKNNIHYFNNYGVGFVTNNGNTFSYNMTSRAVAPLGIGNISGIAPGNIFIDYSGSLGYSNDKKWQLKPGSAAVGSGENGVDRGMFGGPSPYVLSGLPPVPHIYQAIVPASGSPNSGLPVTFKVKSQN